MAFVPEPFTEAHDLLTAFAAMPLRFAPKSLNRILASIHRDFEFSTVHAAFPHKMPRDEQGATTQLSCTTN